MERRGVWESELFTAGHNHQVSITHCPRYYTHAVRVSVMCEASHSVTQAEKLQGHGNMEKTLP